MITPRKAMFLPAAAKHIRRNDIVTQSKDQISITVNTKILRTTAIMKAKKFPQSLCKDRTTKTCPSTNM